MRPQVTHLVPALFGPSGVVGGAERYAYELARHMAVRTPTRLLTFADAAEDRTDGPLTIRVLRAQRYVRGQRNNPLALALLPELLRAEVIHCHQQHVLASSLGAAVARASRKRVFATDLGGGGWDISSYLSTDRWFHGHLHISEYSRRVFGHGALGRAQVILGGVDTERFRPDPEVRPEATVLFVGRILPHKGIHLLIEALPDELELLVIGPKAHPRYLADLKAQAAQARKRVRFRHDCTDAELPDAYRRALCVVLPSVYRDLYGAVSRVPELLGQTLLEGMACGRPAIGTDVASLPEVVDHERTGFIVPVDPPQVLGDRLRWLAAHPAEAEALGRAARLRVEELFRWPLVVERCLRAYGDVG